MFLGGIERDQWHEMGYKWFYLGDEQMNQNLQ